MKVVVAWIERTAKQLLCAPVLGVVLWTLFWMYSVSHLPELQEAGVPAEVAGDMVGDLVWVSGLMLMCLFVGNAAIKIAKALRAE